jgi:hypothetical protein
MFAFSSPGTNEFQNDFLRLDDWYSTNFDGETKAIFEEQVYF